MPYLCSSGMLHKLKQVLRLQRELECLVWYPDKQSCVDESRGLDDGPRWALMDRAAKNILCIKGWVMQMDHKRAIHARNVQPRIKGCQFNVLEAVNIQKCRNIQNPFFNGVI